MEAELFDWYCDKGPGSDEIPPLLLKSCSGVLAPHFTIYFTTLLKSGVFPSCLKSGFSAPIYKSGDASDIKNYRPVVIQSTIAKVFEALVFKRLSFDVKIFLIDEQHDFTKGRSTTTNLVVLQHRIISALALSHQVDCLYKDFAKAFDRVSHAHLLAKLEGYGVVDNFSK